METHGDISRQINEATEYLDGRLAEKPQIGLVLGSGLGPFTQRIENAVEVPYQEIPHFRQTTVEGHQGRMVFGRIDGVPVAAMQGRYHFYEGHSMNTVALPTRVLSMLGVQNLILTNAAGGINEKFSAGDLMLITDHINLMGDNPLTGPEPAKFGPRFPDMTDAYCPQCIHVLRQTALEMKVTLREGVYVGMRGPTYETPAEVRMVRILGGDAVGMSTVPEAIAARHMGVRVTGVSCITNMAAGMQKEPLNHAEVQEVAQRVIQRFSELLAQSIPRIAAIRS